MKTDNLTDAWSLEVVRGPDAGRRYALGSGAVILGNALDGEPGIDLSDQEATAPRKMAPKQARVDVSNGSLTLRDLNSPGGTFVNRQRVLPGEGRSLQVGDVIQLGAVQLCVTRGGEASRPQVRPSSPPTTGARPTASAFLFTLRSGATCRSWDDFLAVSAQRWNELRDELTSGRLGGFLASIGRNDLAPDASATGSPDERLDAWIGRLPTTQAATPELDVHPRTLLIRATAGGGVIRRKIQLSNAGHRLLRTTARIEPSDATWLKLGPEFAGRTIVTVDASEIAVEADLPETMPTTRTATVVLESNGGTARVTVRVEPADAKPVEPLATAAAPRTSLGLAERIARQPANSRLIAWPIAAMIGRLAIAASDGFLTSQQGASPGLLGPAVALGIAGAIVASLLSIRSRGEMRDLPPAALTGAILGAMAAAILVAIARTIESPVAGLIGAHWLLGGLVWAAFGAALAGISLVLVPPKAAKEART